MRTSTVTAVAVIILATALMQLPHKTLNFNIASLSRSRKPEVAAFSHLHSPESDQTLDTPPLKTRVCLNMIVKNEEQDLLKFLRTVKDHITGYMICDTGSTDKTISLAESFFHSVATDRSQRHH
jgi:hypothetical protein